MSFSADTDIQLRAPVAVTALNALNVWRTSQSLSAATLESYRTLAHDEILRALRSRTPAILSESITRPDDLIPAEVALVTATLCTAAAAKLPSTARTNNVTPDTFAEAAAWWREQYALELAAASPVDLARGVGTSFSWARR